MSGPPSAAVVAEAIDQADLVRPDAGPLLLMCSAGRDSMALLDACARACTRAAWAGGIAVLHVDHGLREGAAGDAGHVRDACAALGIAFHLAHAGPSPGAGGGNLQAWARGRRAEIAAACCAATWPGVPATEVRIATAHTRSDLVETALGRLATQPGRRALLAMRAQEITAAGQLLVRPLLSCTREETERYCIARGLTWRDDPSNSDRRFARARLRHEVVPVLRGLNPQAEATIARTLAELALEQDALGAVVAAELPGGHELEAERLAVLPEAIARLVLRAFCERESGRTCAQVASRLEAVLALRPAAERRGRAAIDVGEGVRLELRGGLLRVSRSLGPAAPYTAPRA